MKHPLFIALTALALAGCGRRSLPSEMEIIAEFRKDHPSATVLDAAVGEGDSQHAYWTVRFTEPGSSGAREVEWGARSVNRDSWEIFHKSP